jgi:hypothetical protein
MVELDGVQSPNLGILVPAAEGAHCLAEMRMVLTLAIQRADPPATRRATRGSRAPSAAHCVSRLRQVLPLA